VDGNKHVAVTTMAAFLRVNGYRLELDDMEAFRFLVVLYEMGTLRFKKELDSRLRQHALVFEVAEPVSLASNHLHFVVKALGEPAAVTNAESEPRP
jgi:hypothetical protein